MARIFPNESLCRCQLSLTKRLNFARRVRGRRWRRVATASNRVSSKIQVGSPPSIRQKLPKPDCKPPYPENPNRLIPKRRLNRRSDPAKNWCVGILLPSPPISLELCKGKETRFHRLLRNI